MSTYTSADNKGFTAVELLITMIIASIFLFSGYQLYVQVMRDGREAEKTAIVSNLTSEKLRTKAASMKTTQPSGCTYTGPNQATNTEPVPSVGQVTFSTTVTCPHRTQSGDDIYLYHVKIRATYSENNNTRTLEHATYSN